MKIVSNKYFQLLLALLVGIGIGYITMQEKVITLIKNGEKDAKTITLLKAKNDSNTKTHSVSVTRDNVTTVTTDTVTQSTTSLDSNTTGTEHNSYQEYSKQEINVKHSFIMPFINLGKRLDTAGLMLGTDIFSFGGISLGAEYNWVENTHKEYIGIYFKF